MATVTDRDGGRTLTTASEILDFLATHGIWYRRFEGDALSTQASDEEILASYANPIAELQAEGGYASVDVICVSPETPGLDDMLAKFATEHAHSEDEVRLIVGGRGLFHIHPSGGPVFSIEVEAGDMICVPARMLHWFHLCEDRTIRAIRLFKDSAGWVPEYTRSNVEARYEPLCFSRTTA
jgi:1,2-dihydroxy-3-keto-5-methylthiopentene dioxygenase